MNQRYKFAEMVVLMNTEVNYGAWLLVSILAFHRYIQYQWYTDACYFY